MTSGDLRQQKEKLRRDMNAVRAAAYAAQPRAAFQLHDHFLDYAKGPEGGLHGVIGLYQAFGSEICVTLIGDSLAASGHLLALPVMMGRGQPLEFRLYRPGNELVKNPHGIFEPTASAPAARPATLLIPLLAFDKAGRRLGYGGGYYDRTLKLLRAAGPVTAIGIGFACQQIDAVPAGRHDERLDRVITEKGPVALCP